MPDQEDITRLLADLGAGDDKALGELFAAVYDQLHDMAHGQRRRWRGEQTLNTTALIHEAYLKLASVDHPRWEDRGHFFAVACRAMRQILMDRARHSAAEKRGGDLERESVSEIVHPALDAQVSEDLLALDAALDRLEAMDERQARVVECRFFGGLNVEETAEAVGASTATVKRDWRTARAWLYSQLV
ncbi:MAG: RNA polymerase subunit sigma-70 [Acidobacteria bacterium]|nr:MAG: RNA polymerase subunit sigma-70 [Acidobacteriota bacterium]REK09668.1 MAG: RNA polymerase subunit sigma-70 [Acidobacteriota bacterium]